MTMEAYGCRYKRLYLIGPFRGVQEKAGTHATLHSLAFRTPIPQRVTQQLGVIEHLYIVGKWHTVLTRGAGMADTE